jgi:uncharacterized protein (DUF736 family)
MSATYNNQIEIVLFTNNKRKSDKAPHETGTVTFPDGTKYDVAVWNRVSKAGNPFKSGTLKLPDPKYAGNNSGGGNFGGGNSGGAVDIDF